METRRERGKRGVAGVCVGVGGWAGVRGCGCGGGGGIE